MDVGNDGCPFPSMFPVDSLLRSEWHESMSRTDKTLGNVVGFCMGSLLELMRGIESAHAFDLIGSGFSGAVRIRCFVVLAIFRRNLCVLPRFCSFRTMSLG